MNEFELQRLCNPPLRKRADDDTMRKLLFGGAGAGTGALVNHLIGNRSLTSYLLGGGIGAIGGLGLERLLNSDTSKEAKKRQSQIDQIAAIEAGLGRPLTPDERRAVVRSQNGLSLGFTGLGAGAGGVIQGVHMLKNGIKTDDTFNVKKFIEQQGEGGKELLDKLTNDYRLKHANDPLVVEYTKATGDAKAVLERRIKEQVAGANRNYGTRSEFLNKPWRWANSPGGGRLSRIGKYTVRNFGGPAMRMGFPVALGFGIDLVQQLAAKAKANQLMRDSGL